MHFTWVNKQIAAIAMAIIFTLMFFPSKACVEPPVTWSYVSFYPYVYTQDNQARGSAADTILQVLTQANIPYRIKELPNRRFKKLLEENELELIAVIPSFVTQPNNFLISDRPIASVKLQVFTLEKQTITRLSELKHQPLIVISGYSYGGIRQQIENSDNFIISSQVENHTSGIKALLTNRGKFLLGYEKAADAAINVLAAEGIIRHTITEMEIYLYLKKSLPNAQQLMQKINTALGETNS